MHAANNAHSRSESARSKNPSGIVRPMAFAVFRLIASSNFVGCSIGKSFGWRPFSSQPPSTARSRPSSDTRGGELRNLQ
jgi:hypothetical protein